MEKEGLIFRERSQEDERKVMVQLTKKGTDLQEKAADMPELLANNLISINNEISDLIHLKEQFHQLINIL